MFVSLQVAFGRWSWIQPAALFRLVLELGCGLGALGTAMSREQGSFIVMTDKVWSIEGLCSWEVGNSFHIRCSKAKV